MSYEQWAQDILPEWLLGVWGKKYCVVFGGHWDVAKDCNKDALKSRMPRLAPSDALPYIGSDRILERTRTETEVAFRTRLQDAWDAHVLGGTANGVITTALAPLFAYDEDYTFVMAENDGFHFDNSGWWSRYWIIADGAHGLTQETWGGGVWDYLGVWGIANWLPEDIQYLRRNAWWWTSGGGALPVLFIVVFSGELWGPGDPWGSGTWGGATHARIRLGSYWGLESHDYGAGAEGSEGAWGDSQGVPADTWGVKPVGVN